MAPGPARASIAASNGLDHQNVEVEGRYRLRPEDDRHRPGDRVLLDHRWVPQTV
jgi:hypothetical protein